MTARVTFHLPAFNVSTIALLVAVSFIALGCSKGEEEMQVLAYLNDHYTGEFEIIDKSQRGAKNWFVVEHEDRLFKVAAASVPPHHIVEDRFPDLQYGRSLEALVAQEFHPVVDAKLSKSMRERVRDSRSLSGVVPEAVELYLSVQKPASETTEQRVIDAVAQFAEGQQGEVRWEARFYDELADSTDLEYRPVVPVPWMSQSVEHAPQSGHVRTRIAGKANGAKVEVTLR